MTKRSELGKGIRALLNNTDTATVSPDKKDALVKELSNTIAILPIAAIEANPYQPRTEFDKTALEELTASIKLHGLIQPITVRHMGDGTYQIISGERRWRASQMAGLKEIPTYVRIADDQGMLEMALIENIQRQDLNPLEVAFSYQRLMDECAITHEEVAERVAKKRSTVTNYLRLIKLPPSVQSALRTDKITMGHARVIAGLSHVDQQLALLDLVTKRQMSVRQTESWAKRQHAASTSDQGRSSTSVIDPEISSIQNEITALLGTRVKLSVDAKGKGKLTILFEESDQLQRVLDQLRRK